MCVCMRVRERERQRGGVIYVHVGIICIIESPCKIGLQLIGCVFSNAAQMEVLSVLPEAHDN